MKTKAFVEMFKGHEIIAIWEVDAKDNKIGSYPIVSFGKKKAACISKHHDEIMAFAGDLMNSTANPTE